MSTLSIPRFYNGVLVCTQQTWDKYNNEQKEQTVNTVNSINQDLYDIIQSRHGYRDNTYMYLFAVLFFLIILSIIIFVLIYLRNW